jgi:hypothetical protein
MSTAGNIDLHHERAAPAHNRTLFAVAVMALAACTTTASTAQTQVYRCEGRSGAIEFRQAPCPANSQGESLIIEDRPIGWTPAPADPGTRKQSSPKRKAKAPKRRSGPTARERKIEECRKKRERVEDIDRKLRLGTKGRQNANLHHQRRRLESFLYDECD